MEISSSESRIVPRGRRDG